jgi:hypothetical protein
MQPIPKDNPYQSPLKTDRIFHAAKRFESLAFQAMEVHKKNMHS